MGCCHCSTFHSPSIRASIHLAISPSNLYAIPMRCNGLFQPLHQFPFVFRSHRPSMVVTFPLADDASVSAVFSDHHSSFSEVILGMKNIGFVDINIVIIIMVVLFIGRQSTFCCCLSSLITFLFFFFVASKPLSSAFLLLEYRWATDSLDDRLCLRPNSGRAKAVRCGNATKHNTT